MKCIRFLFQDVNDELPLFRLKSYEGEIWENAQKGSLVEFLDSASPEVYDYDRGSNGTFRMAIENDVTGIFEVFRF